MRHEASIGGLLVLAFALALGSTFVVDTRPSTSVAEVVGDETGAVDSVTWIDRVARIVAGGTDRLRGRGTDGGLVEGRAAGDVPATPVRGRDSDGADPTRTPGPGGSGSGAGGGDAGGGAGGASGGGGGTSGGGGSTGGGGAGATGGGTNVTLDTNVGGGGATANVGTTTNVATPVVGTSATATVGATATVDATPTGGVDANVGVDATATAGPVELGATADVGTGDVGVSLR